jgi:hypothetical protein
VQELEEDLGIPQTFVPKILMKDLGMKHVAKTFVPQLLSQHQKESGAEVAQGLLETTNSDPDFLKKVFGNES